MRGGQTSAGGEATRSAVAAAQPGRRAVPRALLVIDAAVAVTAVAGGVALAGGFEDENLGVDLLRRTPFDSYLWPGVLLTGVVGGSATLATVLTAVRHPRAGLASAMAGGVLGGWIGAELVLLDQPSKPTSTEVVYLAAALAMLGLGLRTRATAAHRTQGAMAQV